MGALADGLSKARSALRAKFPDGTARREAIDSALSSGGSLDPFDDSADIGVWLAADQSVQAARTETISVTSNDPDDLTLRQARQLASATTIYHASDVPPAILDRARADATRIQGSGDPGSGLTLIETMDP